MTRFVLVRLASVVPVMLFAATVVFVLMQILPGNVAAVILGGEQGVAPSPERLAALERELNLDAPLVERYASWLAGLPTLDFGSSYYTGRPIGIDLLQRLPITISLVFLSVLISTLIAIPLGVLSALYRGSWIDHLVRLFCSAGYSVPNFFLAMLVVLVLARTLNWYAPLTYPSPLTDPLATASALLVPALCLGYRQAAVQSRMMRSTMVEALGAEHVRTAEAKGLSRRRVVVNHALRNALLPVVTITGLEVVVLFSGAVVIEKFFNIPGMGSYLVEGALRRDVPVVQAAVFVIAGLVVLVNAMVDVAYGYLDPRVRVRQR